MTSYVCFVPSCWALRCFFWAFWSTSTMLQWDGVAHYLNCRSYWLLLRIIIKYQNDLLMLEGIYLKTVIWHSYIRVHPHRTLVRCFTYTFYSKHMLGFFVTCAMSWISNFFVIVPLLGCERWYILQMPCVRLYSHFVLPFCILYSIFFLLDWYCIICIKQIKHVVKCQV